MKKQWDSIKQKDTEAMEDLGKDKMSMQIWVPRPWYDQEERRVGAPMTLGLHMEVSWKGHPPLQFKAIFPQYSINSFEFYIWHTQAYSRLKQDFQGAWKDLKQIIL
jgi:hypothetical protein